MPRLTPVHWQVLECIFENDGWAFERQRGSHRSYTKPGKLRPLIIQAHREVDPAAIKSLIRQSGMTRERYFELLEVCKKRK